jgi:hypothetical protein
MFEELSLDELRELLRQLHIKQADTERLIREVTERIDAGIPNDADLERRREPRPPSLTPEPE